MLKNLGILIIFFLFATAACMKTQVETNAAVNSISESNSVTDNAKLENSGEKSAEKTITDNPNAKNFRGMINGIRFEMSLVREGEKLSGTYFYTKVGKDLKLSGTIDASGKFSLKETDANGKTTGEWEGAWKEEENTNGIALEGSWKKPNESKDLSFSFYAIQQVVEFTNGVKFLDKTITENDKAKRSEIHSVYPELIGINSPVAKKLNELVKNYVVAANNDYRKDVNEMSVEDIKNLPDGVGLSNEVSYNIAMANNDLVSLIFSDYTFMGGAHGGTSSSTINYDLKNNRELKLEDLFEPNSDYVKTISDYSIADLKKRLTEMSDDEWISKGAGAEAGNFGSWNLTKKGLMFTFDQYQVAAYAAGPQTVIIPYENLKTILRKGGITASLLR